MKLMTTRHLCDVLCTPICFYNADKFPPMLDTCPADQTQVIPDNDPDNPFTVPVTIDSTAFFEMADGVTINDMNYESGACC